MNKLTPQQIVQRLPELQSTWKVIDGHSLHRKFQFTDFINAFSFMTAIALIAEKSNHHPEWKNIYNSVEVWLSTHDADGITDKDFDLAKAMDKMALAKQ